MRNHACEISRAKSRETSLAPPRCAPVARPLRAHCPHLQKRFPTLRVTEKSRWIKGFAPAKSREVSHVVTTPLFGPSDRDFVTQMSTRFDALHSRNGLGFAAGGDGYGLPGNFLAVPRERIEETRVFRAAV